MCAYRRTRRRLEKQQPRGRDRSAQKDAAKNVKNTAAYVPLRAALAHRWTSMTRRQTKELNPAIPFSVLGACPSITPRPYPLPAFLYCSADSAVPH